MKRNNINQGKNRDVQYNFSPPADKGQFPSLSPEQSPPQKLLIPQNK